MKNAARVVSGVKGEMEPFETAYGEPLSRTLDLGTWREGESIAEAYERMEREVEEALKDEARYHRAARELLLERIGGSPNAPRNAGVYQAQRGLLEKIHGGLLFNGGVEACDGTSVVHDTLALNVTQIGVCLVRYDGRQGSWMNRLYRRDLRSRIANPLEELVELLERRRKRGAQDQEGDKLSELARRGIMAYAERAILKDKSDARWRMGHGSPAPYELLTGLWASQEDRINVSLDIIRFYVHEHKRFIFVPSAPRKMDWLTLGYALKPMEFAIVQTIKPDIDYMIETGGYRTGSGVLPIMRSFAEDVGPEVVIGAYRVSAFAPPYLFYAHRECAEMAAHIVMADSMLQEHRNFPMLIDLADTVCRTNFGADDFIASMQTAYARAGQPFEYLGERETRNPK